MTDQEGPYYYRAVPGSRELLTSPDQGDETLQKLESRSAGKDLAPLFDYKGEWLGGAGFDSGVSIPEAVFDRLAPLQSPLEQAVYFHLFRLSYGEAQNWCRVGKRELMNRSRVSDRRLNVALDGLVRKGHIRPLHRNTRGTLYRVYLPSEALGEESEPGLVQGQKAARPPADKAKDIKAVSKADSEAVANTDARASGRKPAGISPASRERPLESPLNEERFADVSGRELKGPGVGEMADWFFKARGQKAGPREHQLAVTVLTGLLEDGFKRQEVKKALAWFVENVPDEKNLDRLPYFINKAIE